MPKSRKLKMPDGGSFELAIPDGFGAAVTLDNEAVPASRNLWIAAAAILSTAAVIAIVKAFGKH